MHNENSAYVMRHVTTHAVMSCVHHATCACRKLAALCIRGAPEITYGRAIRTGRTIFIKINHLTF